MAIIEAKLYGGTHDIPYTIYLTSQSEPSYDGCREWLGQVLVRYVKG